MSYQIELIDPSGTTTTIGDNDIFELSIVRPHTALADFSATIPYSAKAIASWVTSVVEVRITFNSSLLFRGYLEVANSEERAGTTVLEGRGIARDLQGAEISKRYQDTETHVAIQDVWDNFTSFDATVYAPPLAQTADADAQYADTDSEFNSILPGFAADEPVEVQNGAVELLQTCFLHEGESPDSSTSTDTVSDSDLSGGSGIRFDTDGETAQWDFTPDHDIAESDVELQIREQALNDTGTVSIKFGPVGNLTEIDTISDGGGPISLEWRDYANNPRNGSGYSGGDLSAGTTYRLQIDAGTGWGSNHEYHVDVVAPLDNGDRHGGFSYTLDNTVDADGWLSGPQLFPDSYSFVFDTFEVTDNIDAAAITSTWDDTTGSQQMEVSNDGGTNYELSVSNSSSLDQDFTNRYGTRLKGRVTLSRYGSRSTATPTEGFNGQSLQEWDLDYDASDVSTIEDKRFSGSVLEVLQKLHQKAGYRFSIDHGATDGNGDPKKVVESFEKGDQSKTASYTVEDRKPKRDVEGYANKVVVFGATQDDGTRPKAVAEDSTEISNLGGDPDGIRKVVLKRGDLDSLDAVRSEARSELADRVAERSDTGALEIQPKNVLPGYDYAVDWYGDGNTTDTPNERVQFSESHGQASGSLEFDRGRGTAMQIVRARYTTSTIADAL